MQRLRDIDDRVVPNAAMGRPARGWQRVLPFVLIAIGGSAWLFGAIVNDAPRWTPVSFPCNETELWCTHPGEDCS